MCSGDDYKPEMNGWIAGVKGLPSFVLQGQRARWVSGPVYPSPGPAPWHLEPSRQLASNGAGEGGVLIGFVADGELLPKDSVALLCKACLFTYMRLMPLGLQQIARTHAKSAATQKQSLAFNMCSGNTPPASSLLQRARRKIKVGPRTRN